MIDFEIWWNSADADAFRAEHEEFDGEHFRPVWDAAVRASLAAPQPAQADARVGLTDKFEDWWKSLEGTAHRHDEFYVGVDGDWIHRNDVEDIWKTLRGEKTS